jgi:HSP20 family protein
MKTLVPWRLRNGGLLTPFRQDMEDFFGRLFEPVEENAVMQPFVPRVDVEETEKEIIVKADLPGVPSKDVEILFNDGYLVIKGEKKEMHEENKKNYHRVERFFGKFYREVPVPPGTEPEKISAVCENGVIVVTIPKKPEVQPKKIAIKPKG